MAEYLEDRHRLYWNGTHAMHLLAGGYLRPGRYHIGDLLLPDGASGKGFFHYAGHTVARFYTYEGDGLFVDNDGYEYGVDGAAIDVVSIEMRDAFSGFYPSCNGYREVSLLEPTYCEVRPDGTIQVGPVLINTRQDDDDSNC